MDIADAIRDFILSCPYLDEECRVNVDYLSEGLSYSVDPLPCDPVLGRYVDGAARKQYQFALTSKERYDEDARVNLDNSGFYQQFEDWLEAQDAAGNLPQLSGGKIATGMETLNKGYLYDAEGKMAQYRMECRLLYTQEAREVWQT